MSSGAGDSRTGHSRAARPLTQAQILRHAPLCAAILIGAVGVADIARTGFSAYRLQLAARALPAVVAAPQRGRGDDNIAPLLTGHLFGKAPPPAAQPDLVNAPDVGGTLVLSGVIASRDPKVGSAIVGRQGQPTRLYQAGGLLVGLVSGRLYEVYEDRVILDLDGRFETLRFARPGKGPRAVLQAAIAATGESEPSSITAGPDTKIIPDSPARIFRSLNPAPKFARGHFGGLRLMPSENDQQKYGVRSGDLVVAVNGVPLTNASAVNGLLMNQGGPRATVSLTVLRDGTQQVIQVTNGN